MKIVVSFGGGTNSTAVLCNMVKHQLIPDDIIFSDTGGEFGRTYKHIEVMNEWLLSKNFPTIKIVRYETREGEQITLEQDCLNNNTIPAIAFGWKTCSQKFKITPQVKYIKEKYGDSERIQIWVGFDASELRRVKANPVENFENYFPLIEWGWDRQRCVESIIEAGLPLPGKSSCFFCPNMKKHEILSLPEMLKDRVKRMEANATKLSELKGLGRNYSWTDLINADENQLKLFDDIEIFAPPCECIE